jgi:hypothetical protein
MPRPHDMTLGELVRSVAFSRERAQYANEIERRINMDPAIPEMIDRAVRERVERPAATSDFQGSIPRPVHIGATARDILNSGWDFTGLRVTSPPEVRKFLEDMVQRDLMETQLADKQHKLWATINSRFRRFRGQREPA